jgi:succinate dehydrogenase / fumarate reductase cytochrome b subunit
MDLKWVIFYSASMLFLGFHFRHGFWSAFQSLGMMNPRWSKPIYAMGALIALALVVGFFFMPIYLYITQGGAS